MEAGSFGNESGVLECTASHETLTSTGEVQKKSIHRNASLVLGRNENNEIVMKVQLGNKLLKYHIKQLVLHKKFARDGKATIRLADHKVQFMLSNCPPHRLMLFLKTLSTKHECLKKKGFVSDRKRLLPETNRVFQEISPLTIGDLKKGNSPASKAAEAALFTPKGKALVKRKRAGDDEKENPGIAKLQKKRKFLSPTQKPLLQMAALTKEQLKVLDLIKSGNNIFFTGSAGTGKSFLLKKIIGALPPQHTVATASTGVAACHIGGTTLHAFAGIGSGTAALQQCVELASRPAVAQQWRKCHHLIIDEISMVDGEFFDKLEVIARIVKKNDKPFGGIQLILCGDFLQLPPVSKDNKKRKFCFQSKAWRKCVEVNFELTEVKRQSDQKFIQILQNVRFGRCYENIVEILTNTANHTIDKDGILATRLCTHKEDVNITNQLQLDKLKGSSRTYEATDSHPELSKVINNLSPVPEKLVLKVGTQVMLTKNLDVSRGLVNGSRGVITSFEAGDFGLPIVNFICGAKNEVIKPERWTFKAGGGAYINRRQLPLKLAWAISIHKSQGMTLDCVEISLSRVFEFGQAYVALSRARSLQGLRIIDFEKSCVRANPDVLRFYREISALEKRPVQTNLFN
ncbi:ATP-dependent DNA helicase PIF1-like [Tubulanus polymorphus]|uniref:ATP-dependent DNA helicase PIF1-like n=1 Tax=Tubulanus polymorphus TaxID=672921 RepID=UPI003DA35FF6